MTEADHPALRPPADPASGPRAQDGATGPAGAEPRAHEDLMPTNTPATAQRPVSLTGWGLATAAGLSAWYVLLHLARLI